MEPKTLNEMTVGSLRKEGFCVVILYPEELDGVDKHNVASVMEEAGLNFVKEHSTNEGDAR